MLVDANGNPTGPGLEDRINMLEGLIKQLYTILRQLDYKINTSNMQTIEVGILVEFLMNKGNYSVDEITEFRAARIQEIEEMHKEMLQKQQQANVNLNE